MCLACVDSREWNWLWGHVYIYLKCEVKKYTSITVQYASYLFVLMLLAFVVNFIPKYVSIHFQEEHSNLWIKLFNAVLGHNSSISLGLTWVFTSHCYGIFSLLPCKLHWNLQKTCSSSDWSIQSTISTVLYKLKCNLLVIKELFQKASNVLTTMYFSAHCLWHI